MVVGVHLVKELLLEVLAGQSSEGLSSGGDLLISEEDSEQRRRNGNSDEMMMNYNGNEELCEKCDKIPSYD